MGSQLWLLKIAVIVHRRVQNDEWREFGCKVFANMLR